MSNGLNKVIACGNLGQDPELRVTPSGNAVLKLSLGCNESYLDRNNVRQERCEWIRCTIWGKRAEALGKILKKGDRILVEGRLQTSQYEKNGEKRYSTEVVVSNVVLCGAKSDGQRAGGGGGGGGGQRASNPADAEPYDDFAGRSSGGGEDDIPF